MVHDINHLGQPIGWPVPDWQAPPRPSRDPMTGRLCRLEALQPEQHAAPLHAANALDAEGRSWTYMPYGPFESLAAYRGWLHAASVSEDPLFFAIVDRADEQPLGVASYLRIAPDSGCIEVGHIHYSPKMQRSPIATEAMFLMMQRVFDLGYRRYEWKCDALNAASRAAAQRFGFSFEGIFRQATMYKGRNRDTAWYAVVDAEWPALRRALSRWLAPDNFDAQGEQRMRLSELTRPLLANEG